MIQLRMYLHTECTWCIQNVRGVYVYTMYVRICSTACTTYTRVSTGLLS